MFNHCFKSYLFILFVLHAGFAQAAYVRVERPMQNHNRSQALDIDHYFDSDGNQDATNPWDYEDTRYSFVSAVKSEPSTGKDWYTFKVYSNDTKVFLDIDGTDGTWRPWLGLYDNKGDKIAFNDTGEVFDPGSSVPWDSFLFVTLKPGKYSVAVGRDNNLPLRRGQNYVLNIGVGEERMSAAGAQISQVPIPGALWLFGSAFVSLALKLTKKSGYRQLVS